MAQDPENLESMNETNEIIYEFRHFPEMSKIVKKSHRNITAAAELWLQ